MRALRLSFVAAFALASCGAASGPKSEAPPEFWSRWGDGRAEVAAYRLVQPRYGELRHGQAALIFVTETFTAAQGVKSDGGHADEFPVLKLNETRRFQTGIYDYSALMSAFVPLDGRLPRGQAAKLTLSVQEWCGHVFDLVRVDGRRLRRTLHSYFDGEADREQALSVPEGVVFADALPILVRGLAGEFLPPGGRAEISLLPRLLDGRFQHMVDLQFGVATISRSAATETAPTGGQAWLWTVEEPEGCWARYWVEAGGEGRLLAWRRSDGEEGVLVGNERLPYWQLNKEGDEAVLDRLGLKRLPVP